MKKDLVAKTSVSVNATPSKVWEALTNPKLVKQYLYGAEVMSDWKEGTSIVWKGEYQGKAYQDKGIIKKIHPREYLQHTYFSAMSGKEDKPENYVTVTYKLVGKGHVTEVILMQDHNQNKTELEQSKHNWEMVLRKLKEVAEHN
jgi:uncharacterized protein YndB with AHSA1/START domain